MAESSSAFPKRPRLRKGRDARGLGKELRKLAMGAENALEIVRLGRLGARESTPYDVAHSERSYRLRHYRRDADESAPPILLVPPLMLTADVYDVAADISAVRMLAAHGIDPWVVDFGAPEHEAGGMSRTLDDHVRAVANAVERVRKARRRGVHLAGYSQGGMFAYQAAAYLRSEGVASLITFGSPIDIHRNVPQVSTELVARMTRALLPVVEAPLRRIEGLPGKVTSVGFKLFSLRKEVAQMAEFVQKLHDRQALEKQQSRRRFLAGEGFVAWPGPALRTFIDEFVVHNRMLTGGFVVDGRTVSLADITCPVLYFVGTRDDIARPPSVRAIAQAAPRADVYEVDLPAGHFGMVVGSTALRESWPTVVEWLKWRDGSGTRPRRIEPDAEPGDVEIEDKAFDQPLDVELFYDVLLGTVRSTWKRVGDAVENAADHVDDLRYQVPRLRRLGRLRDETRISLAATLGEQARRIGSRTFFLWKGRAFTYSDADRRVSNVTRGLIACGVMPGQHVGVLMKGRPSHLSMVTALNRLGAVAVLLNPELPDAELGRAFSLVELDHLATDPENAARARRAFRGPVLALGGGGPQRALEAGVTDMEAIDPERVELPRWYDENPGRAADVAMILVTLGQGRDRAARITNRRWASSALGAAAACTLTSDDTVYCCLPLHHPAGLLVSVGAALVGGSRLALATRFDAGVFLSEVWRYGATVVFYAGEMCRKLISIPPSPAERKSPIRLFAGSGMRADVWREIAERYGTGVLEFYASTEGNLVLANASGEKVGALGRPLPGSAEITLVRYDFDSNTFVRGSAGRVERTHDGEPGLLLSRVGHGHPALNEPDAEAWPRGRLLYAAFEEGDVWYMTGAVLRRDHDGDYWFVDRVRDVVRTASGTVFPRAIEDAIYEVGGVALCAVYGVPSEHAPHEVMVVEILPLPDTRFDLDRLAKALSAQGIVRPDIVELVTDIPTTDGHRPIKALLRARRLRANAQKFG